MDFMNLRLHEDNTIRLISDPKEFTLHWVNSNGNGRKGLQPCQPGSCKYCTAKVPSIVRYSAKVVDKRDNRGKSILFGTKLFRDIKDAFGIAGTTDCDLLITRTGQCFHVDYHVTPIISGTIVANPDICSCGAIGVRRGMACICPNGCGVIWGC